MYQCGDQVLYGIHGVCRIVALESRLVDRKQVEYYVLEPMDQAGALFYVPTQNQAAVAKLRQVLSPQELTRLLLSEEVQQNSWIDDEGKRKLYYRELINSGDRAALISMVHALHRHKETQTALGKKFHLCDENFLHDAEKLLGSEFSLVLNIPREKVAEYVSSVMNRDKM